MGDERKGFRMVDYHIILASNSPRRKELLSGLDFEYEVKVLPDIEENYPEGLAMDEIPKYTDDEKAQEGYWNSWVTQVDALRKSTGYMRSESDAE